MQKREFRRVLKRERKRLGMSQPQLSRQLGVSQSMISKWENGQAIPWWPNTVVVSLGRMEPLPKERRRFGKAGRPKNEKGKS